MHIIRKSKNLLIVSALLVLAAPVLPAANFSFNGAFTRDDQANLYQFSVAAPGAVGIATTSYAGGGFGPVFSLFDSQNGNLLIGRDAGVDRASGEAVLSLNLATGNYLLALTEYDNLAIGPRFSDGFLRTGDPTFTREFSTTSLPGPFLNIDGNQRTGNFALTITNVATAAANVPEPSSLALLFIGGVGLLYTLKRTR